MKRLVSFVLALVLILALTGCGADTAAPIQQETTSESSTEPTEESAESTECSIVEALIYAHAGLFMRMIICSSDFVEKVVPELYL